MRKIISISIIGLLVSLFLSCETTQHRAERFNVQYSQEHEQRDLQRRIKPGEQVIGIVQTTFQAAGRASVVVLGSDVNRAVNDVLSIEIPLYETAYISLLEVAKNEFHENIDVRDITFTPPGGRSVSRRMIEFTVRANVISINTGTGYDER